jgi:hypothetical protein
MQFGEPIDIVPFAEAVLCEDCYQVTRATNGHCLACGSHSVLNLSAILDRQADGTKF